MTWLNKYCKINRMKNNLNGDLPMNNIAIYNTIGKAYDTTRKPDTEIVKKLIQLLDAKPDNRYLDIGCGTGNYTGALAQQGLNIEGIDVAEEMLNAARKKHPSIRFHQGDATDLPFQDGMFDGATCVLATHHIKDNKKLFQEISRVLKNDGKLVIFTSTPDQMRNYWLCHYFPIMLEASLKPFLNFNSIKNELEQAGFKAIQQVPFFVTEHSQDWFLQAGKYRPEIYLDETVRNGMSAFRLLVNQSELKQGLTQLENDIHSGEIKKIIAEYENELGDYLFILGEK